MTFLDDILMALKGFFIKVGCVLLGIFGVATIYLIVIFVIVFLNDVSGNHLGLTWDIWPLSLIGGPLR